MLRPRILVSFFIFLKVLTFAKCTEPTEQSLDVEKFKYDENILKLHEMMVESVNTKLIQKMEQSNTVLIRTFESSLKEFTSLLLKKIDEDNFQVKKELLNDVEQLLDARSNAAPNENNSLIKNLAEQNAAIKEIKNMLEEDRLHIQKIDSIENSLSTQTRKINNQESSLAEIKEMLDTHITTTANEVSGFLQDFAFVKLKLNEFRESLVEYCLNEIKNLIRDNRMHAANDSMALKEQIKEQGVALKDVSLLLEKMKPLTTKEVSSCAEVTGERSGMFRINPRRLGLKSYEAYCLHDPNNGSSWTTVLRRLDNSTDFYRSWDEYKYGFGNVNGNHWIGLERLHAITRAHPQELWISLEDFEGNKRSATYSSFVIGNEKSRYKLMDLGEYHGDAGDSMRLQLGQKFTTYDSDKSILITKPLNCAVIYKGAWWYKNCLDSNLNGEYLNGEHELEGHGIIWNQWLGNSYSLKYVHMAIRPNTRR